MTLWLAEGVDPSSAVSEQSRFASRAFIARWARETGEKPALFLRRCMLLVYEIGYLRGYRAGVNGGMGPGLSTQVGEQAEHESRALVAHFFHARSVALSLLDADRMLFACEMGYLRGSCEGLHAFANMIDEREEQCRT